MSKKAKVNPESNVLADLEALVARLDEGFNGAKRGDAIGAVLEGSPRTTAVTSLRDHEVIQRFRQELSDGLIRVDTARQVLGLIRLAVEAAMKG